MHLSESQPGRPDLRKVEIDPNFWYPVARSPS